MSNSQTLKFLRIPLYKFYYVENVKAENVLDSEALSQIHQNYEEGEIQSIISNLEWAVKHPDFDFNSLLPGINHSNADIYFYLTAVLEKMQEVKNLKPVQSISAAVANPAGR